MDVSILSMAATAVLALGCLFLILAPLFKWDAYLQQSEDSNAVSLKESLFTTLNEIELDYKMDKMTEDDYKKLKKQYEIEISRIMKDEEISLDQEVDQDLYEQVNSEIEGALKNYKAKGEK